MKTKPIKSKTEKNNTPQQHSTDLWELFRIIRDQTKKPPKANADEGFRDVPGTRIELVQLYSHRILSPACLPVPPPGLKQCQ